MKSVDRLIKRAKRTAKSICNWLASNDDGFMDAIGVDPEQYKINIGDAVGYDFTKALNDIAAEDWADDGDICNKVDQRHQISTVPADAPQKRANHKNSLFNRIFGGTSER